MASTEAVVAEEGEEGVPLVVTGLVEQWNTRANV